MRKSSNAATIIRVNVVNGLLFVVFVLESSEECIYKIIGMVLLCIGKTGRYHM
jgi:hypothetical protein